MFSALNDKVIEYPVVVKGDVQGSVEAIVSSLNKASTDEIKVRVLHSGVGARSEEHTSELQSLMRISYAVFCLKKKIQKHADTFTKYCITVNQELSKYII